MMQSKYFLTENNKQTILAFALMIFILSFPEMMVIALMKVTLGFKNLPKNKSPAPDGFTGEFCENI